MNCGDVIAYLETGGLAARVMARGHLLHCRRCREEFRRLAALKKALSAAEPLTDDHRRRWMAASQSTLEERAYHPASPRLQWALPRMAAAVLVVVGASVWWNWHTESPGPGGNDEPHGSEHYDDAADELVSRQLDAAQDRLVELSRELDDLSGLVALLDERKEADDLLSWSSMHGSDSYGN